MDVDRLHSILAETTFQFRKGQAVVTKELPSLTVTEVFAMPHKDAAHPNLQMVDVHFICVGVDKAKAEARKDELIAILDDYPDRGRLAGGPSYIEVGAEIGDQGRALQLFALGEVLDLWKVVTPERMGVEGPKADEMAGSGFVMMTGFRSS